MNIITFLTKVFRKIFRMINVFIGQLIFTNAAGLIQNLLGVLVVKYSRLRFPSNRVILQKSNRDVECLRKNGYLLTTKFVGHRDINELTGKFKNWCLRNSNLESQGRLQLSSHGNQENFLTLYPQTKSLIDDNLHNLLTQYYECAFEVINIHLYRTRKPDDTNLVSTGSAFGGTACWHSDGSFTDTLKVFFLLSEVSERDGPMQLLDKKKSKSIFKKFYPFRSSKHGKPSSPDFNEISASYTGEPGTCLIVDTNRCLHRASIPTTKARDMVTYYIGVKTNPKTDPFNKIGRSGEGLLGRLV